MKRFYARYELWEDYQNGMYDKPPESKIDMLVSAAKDILGDCERFELIGLQVISRWVVASAVNLTNRSENRRAWIGQSVCCYECEVPEILTRQAWAQLSESQRAKANKVADKIIKHFEVNYAQGNIPIHNRLGAEGLF